jgi:3-oxoacyl-[acyl-carrier protein] reductase
MKKSVIVTGASGTLGSQTSTALLDAGFHVFGVSRSRNLDLDSNSNFTHIPFDLNNLTEIPALVRQVARSDFALFGLVNNSAVGADSALGTMHPADIQTTLNVNLQAPILLSKHVIRELLVARTPGRIVSVTSVVSRLGYRGLSVYAATKSGLEGFSKSLAREVGKRGITVNCVAPGFMVSEMTSGLTEADKSKISGRTSLGRLVEPREVASTIAYLFSPEATGITGQVISVDAGA